ncbi:GNAT family N-acetyltransferase [Chloroflexota bacterium]
MFTIRPFDTSEADYAVVAAVDTLLFGSFAQTAEQWRHLDEIRNPKLTFQRHVIEADGVTVAVGEYGHHPWMYHPRKFRMLLMVCPEHDHPAIRPLYYDHVLAVCEAHDLVALQSGMQEDKANDVQFLQARGFTPAIRMPRSVLDVPGFNPAAYDGLLQKVVGQGIVIKSLRELQASDPDWLPKLHDLDWAVAQDIPATDPRRKQTEEEFAKKWFESPDFAADGWLIALDGEQYIGLSQLFLDEDKGDKTNLQGGLTGVRLEYRRRGIATALKINLIRFAQVCGAKTLNSVNEEKNPMYDLNMKLGFMPQPAWVEYEKLLQTED